jgi:hypothetical protein
MNDGPFLCEFMGCLVEAAAAGEPSERTAARQLLHGVPAPSVRKPTVRTADEGRSGPDLR